MTSTISVVPAPLLRVTMPVSCQALSVSRIVERPTPSLRASSISGGSRSPGPMPSAPIIAISDAATSSVRPPVAMAGVKHSDASILESNRIDPRFDSRIR